MSAKFNFLQFIFDEFFVVLGPFWLYEEFETDYQKKPMSVTKNTSVQYSSTLLYQAMCLRLQNLIKNDHFSTNNDNY